MDYIIRVKIMHFLAESLRLVTIPCAGLDFFCYLSAYNLDATALRPRGLCFWFEKQYYCSEVVFT